MTIAVPNNGALLPAFIAYSFGFSLCGHTRASLDDLADAAGVSGLGVLAQLAATALAWAGPVALGISVDAVARELVALYGRNSGYRRVELPELPDLR